MKKRGRERVERHGIVANLAATPLKTLRRRVRAMSSNCVSVAPRWLANGALI